MNYLRINFSYAKIAFFFAHSNKLNKYVINNHIA